MQGLPLTVEYGGITKNDLLEKLRASGILLNEYANRIFALELFQISETRKKITVVDMSVKDLGFPEGATNPEISKRLEEMDLTICPAELAAFLRLQLTDQPELNRELSIKHQSPADAITVFSKPLIESDDFPKGFYLRKIDGRLWLRGYICSDEHIWKPTDKMIFRVANTGKEQTEGIGL